VLDGRFRFDNFVVGAANRLAASAARAVAESPGAVYNPLFIYSSSGLGKTHLIGAIGHLARTLHPELTTEYVTLEDFVDQLHAAIASGQANAFKRRYQNVGLLLLDDVQFLTGRTETQSEILRVFNALQGSGRQIVMTCDRQPTDIADVDARLLTRLSGGLIVDIGTPDFETRVAILRNKAAERAASFPPGVLEELARIPTSNVRELQGALNRVIANQQILDTQLTLEDVREVVEAVRGGTPPLPDEFESFLSDIAVTVARSVEEWRVRLGERIARWSADGYATGILDRALAGNDAPDVDALEASFAALVERLRAAEREAVRLDAKCDGLAIFRDPEHFAEAEDFVARLILTAEPPPLPDPSRRLSDLVSVPGNQLALRSAAEVIETPGARYNPLVIFGSVGTGKSHLAHAIGSALHTRDQGTWIVACLTGAQFVDELIEALQQGRVERWRTRYRACDALIIDGVQALIGKERSQDELFHLFNVFHEAGKQIVLVSDRPPSALIELEARLRSRFDGGLVVQMGHADAAVREARQTPVPAGDEAAAPPIDLVLEGGRVPTPTGYTTPNEDPGGDGSAGAASSGARLSTRVSPPHGVDMTLLDPEKIVFEWPHIDGRVVEELR
jgi:chromosomal replication initiator protein